MIAAGEIYVADLSEAGSHPVIVVSREALNRGRYALVVAYASAPIRRGVPDLSRSDGGHHDA